jgi:P4 family phage/plasmid primase-like protien
MSATESHMITDYANSYMARCTSQRTPLFIRYGRFWQYDPQAGHYKTYSDDEFAHTLLTDAYGAFPDNERNYMKAVKELKLRAPRLDYYDTPQFRFWGRTFREANYCIALKNGIFNASRYLNEKSRFFYRPSPRAVTVSPREYHYDPEAECPTWKLSLEQWLDLESIELLQEWFGVCCVYEMKYQKFMNFYGPPRSGKSTAQDTLESLVGKRNVSNVGMERFGGEFGAENMINKLLNISPDIARISGLGEANMKAMTTGDRMSQDRKYKTSISITPTARLLLVGNDLPLFADRSEALLDRMLVIPFIWSIPEEERDRDLKFKLHHELPGIFNWAMVGRICLPLPLS